MKPIALKNVVHYWPSPRAPQGPTGGLVVKDSAKPMLGVVSAVHNPRLVDLVVTDHAGGKHSVRFVPFLHDGDHDPDSPVGRCQLEVERAGPGPITLNPNRPEAFTLDPTTGDTSA